MTAKNAMAELSIAEASANITKAGTPPSKGVLQ